MGKTSKIISDYVKLVKIIFDRKMIMENEYLNPLINKFCQSGPINVVEFTFVRGGTTEKVPLNLINVLIDFRREQKKLNGVLVMSIESGFNKS